MYPIDFFWRAAARYPERIAVRLSGAELTYAQLAGRVQSVTAAFTALDAEPQSRVAIGAANSVEHLVALLATLAAGKVWVPLNPRNGTPELDRIIAFTEPAITVLDAAMRERVGNVPGHTVDVAALDQLASTFPARRVADPAEIASAAVFLASDESNFIHGATLHVDGGRTAI